MIRVLFPLVFLGLLCGVSSHPLKNAGCNTSGYVEGLVPAVRDMLNMLPIDEIVSIYLHAYRYDADVKNFTEFLKSSDFKIILDEITTKGDDFSTIVHFACDELLVDVVFYLNMINNILNFAPMPQVVYGPQVYTRSGLNGMILDINDVINAGRLKKQFIVDTQTNEYVQKFLQLLKSDAYQNIVDRLYKLPAFNKILNRLNEMEITF